MTTAPHPERITRKEAAGVAGGLFERHGRMVYGICRAMLRDGHEAEDAMQQVFLSAYQALLRGAVVRDPGGWIAAIARNECRARSAVGMRRPLPVAEEDLDALPAQADEHARRAQLDALRSALAELPERQRQAVVLRYLYGLRYGEVAVALGLSRPATEALLFRARRALRGRLRPAIGAVLVVPSAVRDELALALPGFGSGAGSGVAAAGVTGGVLAKLAAGPVGLKAATAVVAVSTVGAVGAVPAERVDGTSSPIVAARAAGEDDTRRPSVSETEERGEHEDASGRSSPEASDRSGRERAGTAEREQHERSSGPESDGGSSSGRDDGASTRGTSGGDDAVVPPDPPAPSTPDGGDPSGGAGSGDTSTGVDETGPGGGDDSGPSVGSGSASSGSGSGSGSDEPDGGNSGSGSTSSGGGGDSSGSGSGSSEHEDREETNSGDH